MVQTGTNVQAYPWSYPNLSDNEGISALVQAGGGTASLPQKTHQEYSQASKDRYCIEKWLAHEAFGGHGCIREERKE